MCAGDFDGDGYMDIAAVDFQLSQLAVLMNDGTGAFPSVTTLPVLTNTYPHGVLSVDIDLDGDVDILTSNDLGGSVSVFKNAGDGTFALWNTFRSGTRTQFAAAADFDGDGDPDVAAANFGHSGGAPPDVTVFLNGGDGELRSTHRLAVPASAGPIAVSAGDLDNDGAADLVVGSWLDSSLCVFWGEGRGGFSPADIIVTPGTAVQPAIVDLDADGNEDIIVATYEAPFVAVYWNEGDRTFSDGPRLRVDESDAANPRYAAAADFDGDGDPDIASVQWAAGTLAVFENLACPVRFRRGDPNADDVMNIADAITILSFLFAGGGALECSDSADANDDGIVNVADAIYVLAHLFDTGPLPPAPFTGCGEDPTEDSLGCAAFAPCR
jgi:hypothetical protein